MKKIFVPNQNLMNLNGYFNKNDYFNFILLYIIKKNIILYYNKINIYVYKIIL